MARQRAHKPRFFYEPWHAAKSTTHGKEPDCEGYPEEAATAIKDAWGRLDRDADWILRGSKMCAPAVVTDYLSGKPVYCDDTRIIAVRRLLGMPDGSPSNEDVCKRIAECVNALAGVGDPVSFVTEVRALLLHYVRGECVEDPRDDPKVLSLLARCIPPGEQELNA